MQLGDARKLDQRTQEALRQRAVLLVENGATQMEAALAVGVHRGTMSRWSGAFRRNGASGIEKGKRGRRVGDQLILTEAEARRVQGWIANKCRGNCGATASRAGVIRRFTPPEPINCAGGVKPSSKKIRN